MNQETGQTILSGMGELHLEVIKHRILSEFKVDAYMGPLQIAYRETIEDKVTHTETLESTVGGSKHHAGITLTVSPSTDANRKRNVLFKPLEEKSFMMTPKFRKMYKSAIENAVKTSLSYGMSQLHLIILLRYLTIHLDLLFLRCYVTRWQCECFVKLFLSIDFGECYLSLVVKVSGL